MRSSLFIFTVATLLAAPAAAPAMPVVFTFESVVGGNGSTLAGVNPGDAVRIEIVADNGRGVVASTIWDSKAHRSTTITVGALTLVQSGSIHLDARTDDTGAVVAFELFTTDPTGLDGTGLALTLNGARNFMIRSEEVVDAEARTLPANWTVAPR